MALGQGFESRNQKDLRNLPWKTGQMYLQAKTRKFDYQRVVTRIQSVLTLLHLLFWMFIINISELMI